MRKSCLALTWISFLAGPALAAEPTEDWNVADKTAVIRIGHCGEALCGTIVWTRDPGTDENNPDPAKRKRSIVGVQILLGMRSIEPGRWQGEIYNPQNGKTYSGYISLISDEVLRIEGCVLGGMICRGENWTRAR